MGYELKEVEFRIHVVDDYIRASDLAVVMGALNALYETLAAVFVFSSKPFNGSQLKALEDSAVVRVTKIWSGSDVSFSLFGVDKAIDALRKLIEDMRFRKERRSQEEEKTKQEKEKTKQMEEKTAQEVETTRKMRFENIQRELGMVSEIRDMSEDDRREILRLVEQFAEIIDENRNSLLPK